MNIEALLQLQKGFFVMVELVKIDSNYSLETRELFLRQLVPSQIEQGILLQTCNRVELYQGDGFVSNNISRHLFRVVSGLESVLLGETAVVNQVKNAYEIARVANRLNKSLHKLFQTALFVSKRVRKETGISKGAMSHGQAAVQVLFNELGSVKDLNITVIGANSLNEKVIQFLVKQGSETILIGNRTFEKSKNIASKYGAKAFKFDSLFEVLLKTDVLISATAAPHHILKQDQLPAGKEMFILDLAVPRDIDPQIGALPNIHLFNIEKIENQIKKNIVKRNDCVDHAEQIINEEVEIFSGKMNK